MSPSRSRPSHGGSATPSWPRRARSTARSSSRSATRCSERRRSARRAVRSRGMGRAGAAAVRAAVDAFEAHGAAGAVVVEEVAPEAVGRYGIVAPADSGAPGPAAGAFPLRDVVEKPAPDVAPSRLAVAGRYVLSPAVFT